MSAISDGQKPLFSGQPFERMVALLISLVVVQAAVVGYLESLATIEADKAERAAGQYAIQAMGLRARGEIDYSYAYGDALRRWYAYDLRGFNAEERGDFDAAERFYELRDVVGDLSPLLGDTYFGANQDFPNDAAYEVDRYLVESTLLTEQFLNGARLDDAWAAKAQTYVAQLTILAVSLFLFGISTTIGKRTRWLFVTVSSALSVFILGWMIGVTTAPVYALPDEAMIAYAEGEGYVHQDMPDEALEAYNRAIELAPTYAEAYFGRGSVHFFNGELDRAIADFEQSVALGGRTPSILSELGFAHYLNGDLETAIQLALERTGLESRDLLDYFDLGLAYLASGEVTAAQAAYQRGLDGVEQRVAEAEAVGEIVSSDTWFYFDLGAGDIEGLLICIQDGFCEGAPPAEQIAANADVISAAESLRIQLKEYATALEYNKQSPPSETTTVVTDVYFTTSDDLELDEFPVETQEVIMNFTYDGFQDGEIVVVKIYVNGEEDASLRVFEMWELGAAGDAGLSISVGTGGAFILTPGEYQIDMFVDGRLVADGGFYILDYGEAQAVDDGEVTTTEAVVSGDTQIATVDDLGFALTYPADWYSLERDGEDLLFTSNATDTQYVFVYVVFDPPSDLDAIADTVLGDFGMDSVGEPTPITIDDRDGVRFGLTYEDDAGVWNGQAVAVYDGQRGIGLVFSVEVLADTPSELYESLVNNITFLP